MRNAFAQELVALAESDRRVVLLSGDIGNRLFDEFRSRFGERFYNCGVAEANMIGVAAGLAMTGLRPVVYTIVPFATTRCMEQIRVDVCYHNLPVTVVGVGGGLCYAELGATHHSCEDIGMLRLLPGMTVVCPGDAYEVRAALRAALGHDGPVYLRLGKKGEPLVHAAPPAFELGRGIVVRTGSEVWLLSTGNMLPTAVQAAEELASEGVSAGVVSLHTVKPLDTELLDRLLATDPLLVTLEEHSVAGGLGGVVAEWLATRDLGSGKLLRLGTRDEFLHVGGSQSFARQHFGLDLQNVLAQIRRASCATGQGRVRQ